MRARPHVTVACQAGSIPIDLLDNKRSWSHRLQFDLTEIDTPALQIFTYKHPSRITRQPGNRRCPPSKECQDGQHVSTGAPTKADLGAGLEIEDDIQGKKPLSVGCCRAPTFTIHNLPPGATT